MGALADDGFVLFAGPLAATGNARVRAMLIVDADREEGSARKPPDKIACAMCVQCMFTAMTSGAAVSGARSWLGTRRWAWLTPARLRRLTIALLALGLIASTALLGGSSQPAT